MISLMSLSSKSPQNTKLIVSLCLTLLEALNDSCRSAHCDFTSFQSWKAVINRIPVRSAKHRVKFEIQSKRKVYKKCVCFQEVEQSSVVVHPFLIIYRLLSESDHNYINIPLFAQHGTFFRVCSKAGGLRI